MQVIDELVVTLGLDPKNFTDGQKKALADFKATREDASKTAKTMQADGKVAAEFYGSIKREALSAIAVLVGANSIAQFAGKTTTALADVGRIALVMGQAAPDVIAVGMAVERIGGNADAAKQSMLGLSQALERYSRFGEGSLEFKRGLSLIGARPNDTPLEVLQRFADWAKGKKPQDVELIGQQIGLNQDLINETIRGGDQFRRDIATSYQTGIPTDADIKKVTELQAAFVRLGQSLKYAGTELLVDFAGPATKVLDWLNEFSEKEPEATQAIMAVVVALIALKSAATALGVLKLIRGLGGAAGAAEAATGAEVAGGAVVGAGISGALGIAAIAGAALATTGPAGGHPIRQSVYQDVAGNPGAASDADLAEAIEYAKQTISSGTLSVGGGAGFRLGLSRLQAEQTRRAGGGAAAGVTPVAGGGNAIEAFLKSAGWTSDQAHGITAGLYAESHLNPLAVNKSSGAFGIGQWLGERKRALFAFAKAQGVSPTDLGLQLRFLQGEMEGGENRAAGSIRGQTTAGGAAAAFLRDYERPGPGLAGDYARASRYLGGATVNITTMNINAPMATNARGIAAQIKSELSKHIVANANGAVN